MFQCKYIEGTKNRAIRNIAGMKFGKLTAICDSGKRISGSVLWKCVCDCGKEREVRTVNLMFGYTTTCGDRKCRKDYHEKSPEYKKRIEGKLENRLYSALNLLREHKSEWLSEDAKIIGKHIGNKFNQISMDID